MGVAGMVDKELVVEEDVAEMMVLMAGVEKEAGEAIEAEVEFKAGVAEDDILHTMLIHHKW